MDDTGVSWSADDGGGDGLSRDTLFTLLSNQRRRHVLYYLEQRGEQVTIRELSRQVAAWENGVDLEELNYKQRKRVYTSLHQTHLPKLHDTGVVRYDRDRGTVAPGTAADELRTYLDVVPGREPSWPVYYLGLAALSLLAVPLVWFDVVPFSLVPDAALAAVIALVVGVSAAVQTLQSRENRVGTPGTPPTVGESTGPTALLGHGTVADGGDDEE